MKLERSKQQHQLIEMSSLFNLCKSQSLNMVEISIENYISEHLITFYNEQELGIVIEILGQEQ